MKITLTFLVLVLVKETLFLVKEDEECLVLVEPGPDSFVMSITHRLLFLCLKGTKASSSGHFGSSPPYKGSHVKIQ